MPPLADTGLTTVLFLGALGLTIGFLLMRSSRYFSRQSESQANSFRVDAPVATQKGHHLEAPAAMIQWEVQMHETARELSGQLDSKLRLLQQLIREADRAAARLEAAVAAARAQVPGRATETLSPDSPRPFVAEPQPPDSPRPLGPEAHRSDSPGAFVGEAHRPDSPRPLAGEGQGVRGGGVASGAEARGRDRFEPLGQAASQADALKSASHAEPRVPAVAPGREPSSDSPTESQSRQRRFEEIYALADSGLDAAEIAQRLSTPVGEVELILGLRGSISGNRLPP